MESWDRHEKTQGQQGADFKDSIKGSFLDILILRAMFEVQM
jgi:hypothetical protein